MNLPLGQIGYAFAWLFALLSGLITWGINLKIRHDILEHNEKTVAEIATVKDLAIKEAGAVKECALAEIGAVSSRFVEFEKAWAAHLAEAKAAIAQTAIDQSMVRERIIAAVNGTYTRTDLCQQMHAAQNDRLESFRQLVEMSLARIEQNIGLQIDILKERINT